MSKKKGPAPKKKKYVSPTLIIAGSLLSMAKSGLMASNICCLTERLRASRRSVAAGRRLLRDMLVSLRSS